MTAPALRARYLNDSVMTASPGRLLVMLYERLVLDLVRAEAAFTAGDREEASSRLLHAQDIVLELHSSLNLEVWDGADGLAQLYMFVTSELIQANISGDAARVASCRGLIEPMRDAWREVALPAA